MKREIREETGIDIKSYKYFKKYTFIPQNNHNLELTYHIYIAKAPDINKLKIHERGNVKEFTFKEALKLKITQEDKEIITDLEAFLDKKR